jgi:hypothetical protein
MKTKSALILLICLAATFQARAQDYIVSNQGDTILGNIKKEAPSKLARQITFTPEGAQKSTSYAVEELSAYYLQEEGFFERKYIQIFEGADSFPFFLKWIVLAEHSVYSLNYGASSSTRTVLETNTRNNNDILYIPDLAPDQPTTLPPNPRGIWYFADIPGSEVPVLLSPDHYKEILIGIYGPCKSAQQKNYRYTDRGIAQLVVGLSGCHQQEALSFVDLSTPERTVTFRAGAGVQYVEVKSGIHEFENNDFDPAIAPEIAALIEFPLSSNWILQTGFSFSLFSVNSDSVHTVPDNFVNAGTTIVLTQTMDFALITVPLNIKYQFYQPERGITPYVYAGGKIARGTGNESTLEEAVYNLDDEGNARQDFRSTTLTGSGVIKVTKFMSAFQLGIGMEIPIKKQSVFTEVFYSRGRSLDNTDEDEPINTFRHIGLNAGVYF